MMPTVATAPAARAADFVTLAEAARVTGRTIVQIRTLAAAGRIRVDAQPGCRLKYNRADLQRLADVPQAAAC